MFLCPRCSHGLRRTASEGVVSWACPSCDGRAVALSVLRETAPRGFANGLWAAAEDARVTAGRRCPICTRPMVEILAPVGPPVELDVCRPCQFAWFDPKEIDGVAPAPEETEPLPEIPPDPRWVLAMAKVEAIAKRYRAEVGPEPAVGWKFWPGFLGLPIEWEDRPLARAPVVTWTLTALIAVVSIVAFLGDLSAAARRLGFVPVDPLRHWGLTLVTSFLLHGGIWHLAANLYFLLVFGDNVEEDLGRRRYVGLLVGAALAGDLFHGLFDPRPGMPVVGASTAISGIIVYYALRFPEARLGLLFRVWFVVVLRWIRFPAWVGLIGWVALQMLGVRRQVLGPTTISALGHLGGAAVGAAVWLWSRPGAALRPEGSGGAPGTEDDWAWLRQEPRYGLAVAMILVAVLVLLIALGGSPGLGVGVGLLFVAAQFAYCYRFRIIDDWMWAVLAALPHNAAMTHPPATPEQWLQAFEAIVRARDFAGGREMFADDTVAFGTWVRAVSGLDNIVREQWLNVWPRIRGFRFDADTQVRTAGDSAWIAGGWQTEVTGPDGRPFTRPGRGTFVLERRQGKWVAVHSHFSLLPSQSETAHGRLPNDAAPA